MQPTFKERGIALHFLAGGGVSRYTTWNFKHWRFAYSLLLTWESPVAQMIKNPPAMQKIRNLGSIPGLGRSAGGGRGNPLQDSCVQNPHGQRSLAGYGP